MREYHMRLNRGFTLIELLIVIAIIMILMAILFPVFEKVRERGNTASCASNLKQCALAILSYCQDYDEVLPHYGDPTTTSNGVAYIGSGSDNNTGVAYGYFGWAGTPSIGPAFSNNPGTPTVAGGEPLWLQARPVTPYLGSTTVLACPDWGAPSFLNGWDGVNSLATPSSAMTILGNSYAINVRLIFPAGWPDGRNQADSCGADAGWGWCPAAETSVQLNKIVWPSDTGLVGDGWLAIATGGGEWYNWSHQGSTAATTQSSIHGAYYGLSQGLFNIAFADGHVKCMNPQSCATPNLAEYYGGKISWMDDEYKNASWQPGSLPPNYGSGGTWDTSKCF